MASFADHWLARIPAVHFWRSVFAFLLTTRTWQFSATAIIFDLRKQTKYSLFYPTFPSTLIWNNPQLRINFANTHQQSLQSQQACCCRSNLDRLYSAGERFHLWRAATSTQSWPACASSTVTFKWPCAPPRKRKSRGDLATADTFPPVGLFFFRFHSLALEKRLIEICFRSSHDSVGNCGVFVCWLVWTDTISTMIIGLNWK